MKNKLITYSVPGILGILIFASNFLNTQLFSFGENDFAVWFVLSLFCFACGWFIDKQTGWHLGGKIVFSIIIAVALVSVLMITFFHEYFSANQLLTENLILYSLRNITLGAMAIFGMAVVELLTLQKENAALHQKTETMQENGKDVKKEAELELREANLTARSIIAEAELKAKNIILTKERIEKELAEFIQTENELVKKYEDIN